ncbi:MAG: TetR/AcrR family transcriptional regulator [Thermomonas sp.]|uniref:TetR/AcrR family transcriptional regulator n=1 Tax=Thermomonas sp. TaxID=1971895 RepID=UPI001DA0678F|nr:TetR/AcrR family transcriptional regulator [Thermomonas sp.]MBZ0088150.1 TetR/AcrR family transcriptional regulator [Thermomonas sp.]
MSASPRYLPADERRAATVETVVSLAAERNPSDITTTEIATRMGLTQGALFRHFVNKDAIVQAVMAWVSERLLSRLDAASANAASPLAALEAMFLAHAGFVADHPGVPRMLFAELQRPSESVTRRMVQALLSRYRQRLQQLFDAAKAKGQLDSTLDVDAAISLFIGTVQGLVMQSLLSGNSETIRRDAPRAFAIYRRGIEARP